MNTNPPKTEGFGPAPFLPPPPSKAGKREDRYAALESIAAPKPPMQFLDQGRVEGDVPSIFTTPPVTGEVAASSFSSVDTSGNSFNGGTNSFGGMSTFSSQQQSFSTDFSTLPAAAAPSSGYPTAMVQQPTGFSQADGAGFQQAGPGFLAQNPPTAGLGGAFPQQQHSSGFPAPQPTAAAAGQGGFPPNQAQGGYKTLPNPHQNQAKESVMKLDSLFTDLDPLGTGKSKPYTDKKDFFAVKATPMMGSGGGAVSQESH